MADERRRLYWDTTCFISFLNRDELDRRAICEDILRNARDGNIVLYTSTFTIAKVVYPRRSSVSNARVLTTDETNLISNMFRWTWLRKLDVDQRVAHRAVEYSRDYGLAPADAIHAATAVLHSVDALQKWDRDFNRIAHLVTVEEPSRISLQGTFDEILARIGPHPGDFSHTTP